MRNLRTWIAAPLLVLLALAPGCNEESPTLDEPDDANSVLEVLTMTTPTATAQGDISDGTCTINISTISATLANKPKSEAALGSPFNDIALQWANFHYTWDDPTIVTSDRQFSLAGTVPIGGQQSVTLPAIAFGDFDASMQGHTMNAFITFHGRAISGEPASVTAGVTMSVGGACSF